MKKIFTLLLITTINFQTFSQTHLYEHPEIEEILSTHEIIAILPFSAKLTMRPKQLKDFTPEQLDKMEKAEGEEIQRALYSWYLKREKRGSLTVKLQDLRTTTTKLKKAGISSENIDEYLPEELAKILGVDSVFMGSFETTKPMSEAGAIVLGVLTGFFGKSNKAVLNLYVYNGKDGELLVNYNKSVKGGLGSSTEDLINKLMRKSTRRIPYTDKSVF